MLKKAEDDATLKTRQVCLQKEKFHFFNDILTAEWVRWAELRRSDRCPGDGCGHGGECGPSGGRGHGCGGAGRGFNLGVAPTEACCHCDTLPLFSQQRLCYSLCCAINTLCFLYNTVWRNWFPFLISLRPFEDFRDTEKRERSVCPCQREVGGKVEGSVAELLLSKESFFLYLFFTSLSSFLPLPHIDKAKSACPKTLTSGKSHGCPYTIPLFFINMTFAR